MNYYPWQHTSKLLEFEVINITYLYSSPGVSIRGWYALGTKGVRRKGAGGRVRVIRGGAGTGGMDVYTAGWHSFMASAFSSTVGITAPVYRYTTYALTLRFRLNLCAWRVCGRTTKMATTQR